MRLFSGINVHNDECVVCNMPTFALTIRHTPGTALDHNDYYHEYHEHNYGY